MPQQPFSNWTPGAALADYRELVYGNFVFALTAQEVSRDLKLGMDRKKIPNGWGDFISINSVTGREIEIEADMGSGLMGSSGNTILTQDDLEAERAALAGLQAQGRQKLWVRPDRYIWAYLSEFEHKFFKDGGAMRYATWTVKFVADDPRYYAATPTTMLLGPFTDTATHTQSLSQVGNVRAYPIITISDACASPMISISQAGVGAITITFSQLTMNNGDTLVVNCDPRPENRDVCVQFTPANSATVNGLRYSLLTDFVNTLDDKEWFPYIEAPAYTGGTQTFSVSSASAGDYSVSIKYSDTWI